MLKPMKLTGENFAMTCVQPSTSQMPPSVCSVLIVSFTDADGFFLGHEMRTMDVDAFGYMATVGMQRRPILTPKIS